MVSRAALLAAALVSVASGAAVPCKPVVPTLPSTGNTTADLPNPPANVTVKRIAIGHGIQNYSCSATDATVQQVGALAVLYDVTSLYPGTPRTGLDQAGWDNLPATLLFSQDLPINLVNASAASPGSPDSPNALPESAYLADTANPFPAQADVTLGGKTIPFLGHHFFDASGTPTFDLSAADMLGSVLKVNQATAPSSSNKGVIGTGAVPWLQLSNLNGNSRGVQYVYRVITAGGVAQACSVAGQGFGSVPYTAFYWVWA